MKLDNEQMEKITQLMASGVIDANIQKDILDTWFGNKMITGTFTNQYMQMPITSSSYTGSNTTPPWPMSYHMPSVTEQYPITNLAWTEFKHSGDLPSEVKSLYNNNNLINMYFKEVSLLDTEKFVARLENTRLKQNRKFNTLELSMGHTYDPWYRSISSHQRKHYTALHIDNRFGDETELQIRVGPNHQESILIWGFSSTINKKPITLILYTIAELEYVNSKKKNSHLKFIHPYMCSISDDYHLRHTP